MSNELLDNTLGSLLDEKADLFSDCDAVIYPHEKIRQTYAQFRDTVNQAARGFIALGISKGDHVAIWATNHFEWLVTQFATAKIGAVMVTVNTNYKRFELEYLLRQSDSMSLILMEGFKNNNFLQHVYDICPELLTAVPGELNSKNLPLLKNVICIDKSDCAGMFSWKDLIDKGRAIPQERVDEIQKSLSAYDVINMQYTSGTTGFPKGVMLTHHNIVNDGKAIGDCMNLSEKDRLCIPVPLFHCFGCVLGVMACVTHATAMIMVESFNPIRVMEAVQWEKCTALHGVPTMFISILSSEEFSKFDFSTLRTGIMAGSPCPVEVMKRITDEMNMTEMTIAFGLTESSPVITQTRTTDPLEVRVSTIGRALPNMEVKIVDPETGADLPVNTQGEIVTRGYQIMKGYYKMPEATKQAIDEEGFLHTGDLGTVNEDGYFKITGRLKDMIIRGGENIYPREIEEFLYTHPDVKDVQVVGVPDQKYGEEVLAFVILKGERGNEQEMIDFVRQGLSRYKAPRYVRFIDSFPMTASGKIQKYKLRETAIDMLGLQSEAEIETA